VEFSKSVLRKLLYRIFSRDASREGSMLICELLMSDLRILFHFRWFNLSGDIFFAFFVFFFVLRLNASNLCFLVWDLLLILRLLSVLWMEMLLLPWLSITFCLILLSHCIEDIEEDIVNLLSIVFAWSEVCCTPFWEYLRLEVRVLLFCIWLLSVFLTLPIIRLADKVLCFLILFGEVLKNLLLGVCLACFSSEPDLELSFKMQIVGWYTSLRLVILLFFTRVRGLALSPSESTSLMLWRDFSS